MLLILYEHAKRLDLEVMLDAFGTDLSSIHLVLATSFPHPEVTYAIPYGANRLDNLMPDSGPQDDYGFPRMDQESWRVTRLVQGWLDLSDEAGGLTIASNRRLFRIEGSALHCVLLRLTPHAQPQRSCFSLIPHDGRWDVLAPRSAEELLMPMIAYTVNDTVSRKSLPTTASFLVVEPDNVSIVAVKQGEDRSSIVVRLVETCGRPAEARLVPGFSVREARRLDLTERDLGPLDPHRFAIGPWEILTIGLKQ
jgi:alpha-mannosidase